MSATKQTTIHCDVYQCESSVLTDEERVRDAEEVARSYGWRCVRAGDFCEVHAKAVAS